MTTKKRWKEDVRGIAGLDYIVFKNVPMRASEHGDVIDQEPEVMEKLAAKAIIGQRIPLRGLEVKFLRKALGLSMERFASRLDLTSGAVFKWERAATERLHSANEAVVRAFFAEQLGVDIPGKLSELVGVAHRPAEVVLKAS